MPYQIEHGHTRIANALLEKLFSTPMPVTALRFLLWVVRSSYGYGRKKTLSNTLRQISEATNMSLGSISNAIKILVENGVISVENGEVTLNKNNLHLVQYLEQGFVFKGLNKSVQGVEQNVQGVEQNTLILRKETFKERTKESEFASFWEAYPRKVGKGAAIKAWLKVAPPLKECLDALAWQTKTEQWAEHGGKYIPHPTTWINQQRWLDMPQTGQNGPLKALSAPVEGKYANIVKRASEAK